ncbi:MAG: endonuclease MutS2 [Planctomycetes bacterium]|nr:endonuclease MutS2 [Planctomycetota bacterium]
MDAHSLQVLEFDAVRKILRSYASSSLARSVIDGLEPSTDPDRLKLSLRQVDEARALLDGGSDIPVGGLQDMVKIIGRGHGQNRALGPEELLLVARMIVACGTLCRFFREVVEETPTLSDLANRLLDHTELLAVIEGVVEAPGVVLDRASPKLWELRRRRNDLEERIRAVMDDLVTGSKYKSFLQERTWSVRNGRYVLMVKEHSRGHVPGILHDKSASGETVFVEPNDVVASANQLADVKLDEQREIGRILLEVSQRVYAEEKRLGYSQNVAAWLDFTRARACMSQHLGLVPARLVDEPVLRIRTARHPLLMASRSAGTLDHDVVPVTVTLGDPFRMLVVTGPNTGGKTVALKTVGLVQLMFQSGLHVPAAAGIELPCLDGVFADIGDEQSLSQNLSTFSGHVANIVRILDAATPRSLVLLDELGAGTDPAEGAALGEAVLEQLFARGSRTVVTTHLGDLKTYAFSRSEVENASVAFDPQTLEPTYELIIGQPGASQALTIARRHGMPEDVVALARQLTEGQKGRADELMHELMKARVAAERSRQQSADLVQESREKLSQAADSLHEAEQSRDRIEQEAESEVTRILERFQSDARPHLNALKNVPKGLLEHVGELEALLLRRLHTTSFATRRREFLAGLKKHDEVYVPRYGQICRIEKVQRADERLTVRVGGISMQISFDDVSWVTPPDATRG